MRIIPEHEVRTNARSSKPIPGSFWSMDVESLAFRALPTDMAAVLSFRTQREAKPRESWPLWRGLQTARTWPRPVTGAIENIPLLAIRAVGCWGAEGEDFALDSASGGSVRSARS